MQNISPLFFMALLQPPNLFLCPFLWLQHHHLLLLRPEQAVWAAYLPVKLSTPELSLYLKSLLLQMAHYFPRQAEYFATRPRARFSLAGA